VSYVTLTRFPKDVVCHCMADEPFEVRQVNIYPLGKVFIGDLFVKFDGFRNLELVDGQ
jgi:hypothetical protein